MYWRTLSLHICFNGTPQQPTDLPTSYTGLERQKENVGQTIWLFTLQERHEKAVKFINILWNAKSKLHKVQFKSYQLRHNTFEKTLLSVYCEDKIDGEKYKQQVSVNKIHDNNDKNKDIKRTLM